MKAPQEKTKSIGWNSELERQIRRGIEDVKAAYLTLRREYAAQGLEFSLEPEASLTEVAYSVKIETERVIPIHKRLELLGISPTGIIKAHEALEAICAEVGISPAELDDKGDILPERKAAIIGQSEIVVRGADAVHLADELELVATAVERFYKLMANRGQNPPAAYAISMAFNQMLTLTPSGQCRIVPHAIHMYTQRTEKQ
jgi:hypothetical protein